MIDHGEADQALYECEDCGIVLPIGALESGCPRCGETMVPHAQQAERERERDDPACHRGTREAGGGVIDLRLGDCLAVMRTLDAESVDAICADPPAGISFMGRDFDNPETYLSNKIKVRDRFIDFLTPRLAECLRVARPGARMLCWAIPRTSHWTGTAVEDAGWIVEDIVSHLFGTGFPKSKGKLKPACEFWYMARKPGGKVPALEIDRCRIQSGPSEGGKISGANVLGVMNDDGWQSRPLAIDRSMPAGRYPANLILSHIGGPDGCREVGTRRVKCGVSVNRNRDGSEIANAVLNPRRKDTRDATYSDPEAPGRETVAAWECVDGCPIAELDAQSLSRGIHSAGSAQGPQDHWNPTRTPGWGNIGTGPCGARIGDSGGASRFFATFGYFPKASRSDRGEGNTHPTCKNTGLMSWLARLITPAGGTVLDPFLGSGSTGVACIREGFSFIGIEQDPEYFRIAEARISRERAKSGNLLNLA